MLRTTPDWCMIHGHQDFIDFDHQIHCPLCFPGLFVQLEQSRNEEMQRLIFSLPAGGI